MSEPYDQDAEVSDNGALRFNVDKPKLSQVFWFTLDGLAAHMEAGRDKYPDAPDGTPNWRLGGQPVQQFLDSICRHVVAIVAGEVYDAETGTTHADAIAWNALAMRTNCYPLDEYPARRSTSPAPQSDVAVTDDRLLRTVEALSGSATRTEILAAIGEDNIAYSTLYYRLQKLEQAGLLHRPGGNRAPFHITPNGREAIQ